LASGDHKPEPLDIPSLGRREHSLTLNGAYRIEQISTELDLRFSIARKLAFTEVCTEVRPLPRHHHNLHSIQKGHLTGKTVSHGLPVSISPMLKDRVIA
jgi:hypothetical protein